MTNATAAGPAVLSVEGQLCSTKGCKKTAAFKTRSKPAWCIECIDAILLEGGLRPEEPFINPKEHRLTACVDCGVQAHYKLVYTVVKNAVGEKTCRACYWTQWARQTRAGIGRQAPEARFSRHDIEAHLDLNGFDLIALTTDINDGADPIITLCRSCKRISAQRMGDIGWGCACTRNTRSAAPALAPPRNIRSSNPATPRIAQRALADSDDAARDWWDHERNDEKAFHTVTLRATRACWWKCPECRLSFQSKVLDMTAGRHSCPHCSAIRKAEWDRKYAQWKMTPVSEVPELAAAWADDADPQTVMVAGGGKPRRFQCPAGHYPRVSPYRFLKSGCPSCRGAQTRKTQKNWLADTLPEIASQWHPARNGVLTSKDVVWDSTRTVWWLADCCGYEWQETPRSRDKYDRLRCPQCRTILGSLAWHDPGLAAEWSQANTLSSWEVRPNASTSFAPEWICATDPTHRWRSSLSSRSNGSDCPECKVAGKSKVELEHYAAAKEVFTQVRSGAVLRSKAFSTRPSWTADICAEVGSVKLVIEYDGAYWHQAPAKFLVDKRKTADLLAAGYTVVRLREDGLAHLSIQHPQYREIRVYSSAPRPREVIAEVQAWLYSRHVPPLAKTEDGQRNF